MKRIVVILVLLSVFNLAFAKQVDPETAKIVAQNHYLQICGSKGNTNFELVYTSKTNVISDSIKSVPNEVPLFYVFNANNDNGYVIVSGDDNVLPVLGYSTTGNFDYSNLPPNFRKWLEGYKNQIRYVIKNNLESTDKISSRWDNLIKGVDLNNGKSSTSVNPLLTTAWNQNPFYNDQCPEGSITGCVATAMAQIMNYWEYPIKGSGFHSYSENDYGTLSANFGATTYQWSLMPNSVTSSNSSVATLMYHCGVSIDMNYSPESSGAYLIETSPTPQACSEYAFTTYFGYDNTVQGVERINYSTSSWVQLLKNELDAGRPIEYAGFGTGGGHAFVCDGYDINGYFHFNWGWGGLYNDYFSIDALDPEGIGAGGGAGGYNTDHQAVIGIKPPASSISYDLSLYDNIVASENPLFYGNGFTVHTDIANLGTTLFSGDYCAAIFDDSNNFVEYVEILSGYTLGAGQHYVGGLDFINAGMLSVLPGSYQIGIFYKPTGGNWIQVGNGSYSNMISFDVYYPNDIELYQEMIIDYGTTISQNQPFKVTLDILNDGSSIFNGEFNLSLYKLDGDFAESIQTLTGASLDAGFYYNDLEFTTSGVSISPGTYLMALSHTRDGGSEELTGSTYFTNPIKVIIKEAAIIPDIYESNNIQNDAYNLIVNFIDDNTVIETTSSNLHIGSDYDYYKINLDPGFDYTITVRVHDSYNSGNGQTYTGDVLWSYLNGSEWSEPYDDVMAGNIIVNDGGTVYFHIAPYFAGEKGTYLLDLDVSRSVITSKEDIPASISSKIFPNPVNEKLYIETENKVQIDNVKILDMLGKEMLKIDKPVFNGNHIEISVNQLPNGIYMLIIQTKELALKHKFVISK